MDEPTIAAPTTLDDVRGFSEQAIVSGHVDGDKFKVTVEGVRTNVVRGKVKRVGRSIGKRPNFKKAVVTLKQGDSIELFEGGAA